MRIGTLLDVEAPVERAVEEAGRASQEGFASAWAVQIFGHDALTLLALVGSRVPRLELGTGVVPVYTRHPQALAQQALSTQQAIGGRLTLGIGLSHQLVVEGLWGMRYEHGARYMREYLSALMPMLAGETVSFEGTMLKAVLPAPLSISVPAPPSVLVAALGPVMLRTAGELADGTITWMTGLRTVGNHISPRIVEAAEAAGRPRPRVVVCLPVTVTSAREQALESIDRTFALYPSLPSYRAMLDREGADKPSDVALVGSEEEVVAGVDRLREAGATEFVATVVGTPEEMATTRRLVVSLAGA